MRIFRFHCLVLSILSMVSCLSPQDPIDEPLHMTKIKVSIALPNGFNLEGESLKLKCLNRHTNESFSFDVKQASSLSIELEEGIYDLDLSNDQLLSKKVYTGALNDLAVKGFEMTCSIVLSEAYFSNSWLISEVHYTANETDSGFPYLQDGYIELYNNTDRTLYADGLCFSRTYMLTTEDYNIWSSHKGVSVPFYILEVPGKGQDYPVKSGGKLLIAVSAINHHMVNKASKYDLSQADFEMYSENNMGDIDNAEVRNMNLFYIETSFTPMMLTPGEAYFIFRPTGGQTLKEYLAGKAVKERENNGEYVNSFAIPDKDIIDAVQISVSDSEISQKVLPAYLDAGYTYCRIGAYNFVSKRKVLRKEGGRLILQDTNNSAEDFLPNQKSSYLID